MTRTDAPPPMAFFRPARPALGGGRMTIDLGGLGVVLDGADDALLSALRPRFGPWESAGAAPEGALVLTLAREDREYFIDPPASARRNPVRLAFDGPRLRYLGHRVAGWFDAEDGRGQALVGGGEFEPVDRAVENFVRAAVAWHAAASGGALVHAAGIVRDGRGYLFYGESGAGKTTLCRSAGARGRVVSDDLSLVLAGERGGLELVGAPFRSTFEGAPVLGRFPLAAGFRLVQDDRARVRPVPRARALGELVANLPFVVDALPARPDLLERVRAAFDGVELAHLHFRPDDSFWDAIAEASR